MAGGEGGSAPLRDHQVGAQRAQTLMRAKVDFLSRSRRAARLSLLFRLKGQLCNTLSNRLALRNGAPPLTEADRKAAEERLQRLRRDADNKRLAIKNLKLALERLDITE